MSTRKPVPPDLFLNTAPNAPITPPESVVEDSEMDDECTDLNEGFTSTRPLTVAIPRGDFAQGPYCPRRPNLAEILRDEAQPPWTLSAFMAYLSQNHCLETLEFTMDAARYKKHYEKMVNRNAGATPDAAELHYVRMLWQKLLDAYIAPNGAREVNLPSDIRDSILAQHDADIPPHPSELEMATTKVYELMEESVLMPFLNTYCPTSNYSGENLHHHAQSYDERAMRQRERDRGSPPDSATPTWNRASAPSSLSSATASFTHFARHGFNSQHSRPTRSTTTSAGQSNHTSSSSVGGLCTTVSSTSEAVTDESGGGSVSSPTTSQLSEPMTPPTTPPMSDYSGFACGGSPTNMGVALSPRVSRGESGANAWKRMGSKLGLRKSRTVREDEMDFDIPQ